MTGNGVSNTNSGGWTPQGTSDEDLNAQADAQAAQDFEAAESFDRALLTYVTGMGMAMNSMMHDLFNQKTKDEQKQARKMKENLRDG